MPLFYLQLGAISFYVLNAMQLTAFENLQWNWWRC